jgi:hypothetical protein
VKSIAARYHARIELESNGGTTVTVEFQMV